MLKLQDAINRISEELMICNDCCAGVWLDRDAGIIPRSLFLERPDAKGQGCFAVGLNPGTSPSKERAKYREPGITLQNVNDYRTSISNIPYLARSRLVVDELKMTGPILWSNLAKCENQRDRKGLPPLQTLRHCTRRFLRSELAAIPADWAMIGIGWEAYRALAYLVPERSVIGIPHPTGGFRDFRKMIENGRLRIEIKERALRVLRAAEPGAVWLGAEKAGA